MRLVVVVVVVLSSSVFCVVFSFSVFLSLVGFFVQMISIFICNLIV